MLSTVTSSKSSRVLAIESICIVDPEEGGDTETPSGAKQLWRATTPAALHKVLRNQTV